MKAYQSFTRSLLMRIVLVLLMAMLLVGCAKGPEPVAQPASGTILSGYAPKDASQITVTLENTGSSVVSLKDTSGRTLLSFFVRGGDTVSVDVPAEMMYVHFASGTTWYGEEHLFGDDTVYRQDKELTDFIHNSWEYELNPMSIGDFEYEDSNSNRSQEYALKETQAPSNYIADLGGQWESVHLKSGNSSLNVSARAFSQTVYDCTEMTINMNVEMNAGTKCKDWQVWGRTGGKFVKIAKIYLAEGNGFTSETISFNSPVSFDAIAVTPTITGGYSWSMGLSVTDVYTQNGSY